MTDFAKAQLLKYGWTEGRGLGKNENGMTEALKPKLKFDTAGVGHKDTWNEWWETAFNKAANSIVIDSQSNGVSISISKKGTTDEVCKKDSKKYQSKNSINYGNFLKTSTLFNGKVIKELDSDKADVEKHERDIINNPLTDEELFKACGGRTAHKGARHGLTLNGKLERIAQQEKDLLNAFGDTSNRFQVLSMKTEEQECGRDGNANTISPLTYSSSEECSIPTISKTARKRQRKRINDLTHQLNIACNMKDDDEDTNQNMCDDATSKKKSKRKRSKDRKKNLEYNDIEGSDKEENKEICDILHSVTKEVEREKAKKIKIQEKLTNDNEEQSNDLLTHSNKKKKSKRKRSQGRNASTFTLDQELNVGTKKSKKVHKKDLELLMNEDIGMIEDELEKDYSKTPASSNEFRDLPLCLDTNARIKKIKRKKFEKKQQNILNKITEGLKTVHFDNEQLTETSTKVSAQKKLESIVDDMTAINIVENKTDVMKKKSKKNKRKMNKNVVM